ncbi:hypothetical protein HDU97_004072 [Phlyctochytrium planicorne]|nr:hypothetical protein HDU97_004072 [Phlyctochytrium planicorne]
MLWETAHSHDHDRFAPSCSNICLALPRYHIIKKNGQPPTVEDCSRDIDDHLRRKEPDVAVVPECPGTIGKDDAMIAHLSQYTRNFYRATWVLTALDAGFLSAMHVRPLFLRDFLQFVFFIMYLFYADAADEKVRKFRAVATVDIMRASWNKSLNPYLRMITFADRGFLRIRHDIKIPRPIPASPSHFTGSGVPLRDIPGRLFFAGSREELKHATCLVLDFPGGGFVSMPPKCHEDYLSIWARQTRVPIVSIDYGKAPEFPYPYALEECFDAYRAIADSNGSVVGLEGWYITDKSGRMQERKDPIKIIVVGDSAGGNFAAGCVLKCLESKIRVPPPAGVILIYPCLDFDMECWMPRDQMRLFRAESKKDMSMVSLIELHSSTHAKAPLAVPAAPRSINVLKNEVDRRESWYRIFSTHTDDPGPPIPSALSMTSRMSYFTDRLISPELLRGMALLYLGSSPAPINIEKDYYLSPVKAPDEILARFPRSFLICGEKDPLVDDMVIFAGRLRQAKVKARREWERLRERREKDHESANNGEEGVTFSTKSKSAKPSVHFDQDAEESNGSSPTDSTELPTCNEDEMNHHVFHRDPDSMVRVKILEGMSHAILQMCAVLPEAKQTVSLLSDWALELFEDDETAHQVGVAPGDEVQSLTDYLTLGMSENRGKGVPRATPSKPIPINGDHSPFLRNGGLSSSSSSYGSPPPRSVFGALAATTSEELLERSSLKVNPSGATIVGSRTSSPRMPRSKLSKSNESEKVTEQNFLERRNRALADNYDI